MVRETLWAEFSSTGTIITGPQGNALLNTTGAPLTDILPWTIVRVRGYIHLESDQNAAAENQAIAIGMAVVSDQAVAIGVTAVPTPVADGGSDLWFMYQQLMTSSVVDGNLGIGMEYDSRAMRKVEDGQQLVVVLGTEVAALTAGVFLRHMGRLLIKLH